MTSTTAAKKAPISTARRAVRLTLVVAFWVAVWQIVAWVVGRDFILASPVAVIARLAELIHTWDFWTTVGLSLFRITLGFALAAIAGSLLAALAARFGLVEALFSPLVAAIRSVPVVSFIILVLLWADSSMLATITSFLIVLPIVYGNVFEGILQRDRKMLEFASVFRVPWRRRILAIDVPAVLPYFAAACRIGVGLAWKSGVAAEVIGVIDGSIGERLYEAKIFLDSASLFAWTIVIVALSMACEAIVLRLVRRLPGGAS
ncbi:MAG: ABC transporter permease subunit [Demequinaceae bacterium]|nr:ABC transporter permease subunit [Demequinaceae bacterium]